MVSTEFARIFLGTILEYAELLIVILIMVKLIKVVMLMGGKIKDSWGNRDEDSSNKNKNSVTSNDDKNKTPKEKEKENKLDEQRKKFEEGIKNPAYLKVWVRDLDDRNLEGAEITIKPQNYSKEWSYNDQPTNNDGIAPSDGGSFVVPSNYPIDVIVKYKLKKGEKYKSQKKWIDVGPIELIQKRSFKNKSTLNALKSDEVKLHAVQLMIISEQGLGFEPYIQEAKIKNDRLYTKGVIKSNTNNA